MAPAPAAEALIIGECGVCDEQGPRDPDACMVPISYASAWADEGIKSPPPRQICGYFDMGFIDGVHADLWRSSAVIVGMHPDQATEPIVDAALRLNKPFAVVPCCVFPDAFPERALDGAPVRSYAQFLDYLRAKDPGIETAYLPFQGRSRVLYKR